LGIEADENINQQLAEAFGVKGVVVLRVAPGSAAARAGLRGVRVSSDGAVTAGDIITAVQGQAVDSLARLAARLDDFGVGDRVAVTVLRQGRVVDLVLTLQAGA
jgi:S1-C subfamily serine protease